MRVAGVLILASSAAEKVRAERVNAVRGPLRNLLYACPRESWLLLDNAGIHSFAVD